MNIYTTAWDKGLKTTYYLHMKPRHTAEQSTVSVNKGESIGKKGFASLGLSSAMPADKEKVLVDAVSDKTEDPQDKLLCESCQ
jgi:hypothetical protein